MNVTRTVGYPLVLSVQGTGIHRIPITHWKRFSTFKILYQRMTHFTSSTIVNCLYVPPLLIPFSIVKIYVTSLFRSNSFTVNLCPYSTYKPPSFKFISVAVYVSETPPSPEKTSSVIVRPLLRLSPSQYRLPLFFPLTTPSLEHFRKIHYILLKLKISFNLPKLVFLIK